MKAIKFIAVLLLVVLTTSDFLSIYNALNDSQTTILVCENTSEEEKESEEKEEVDGSEYFLLDNILNHTVVNYKGLAYFTSCTNFSPIDQGDIFEPPENLSLQA